MQCKFSIFQFIFFSLFFFYNFEYFYIKNEMVCFCFWFWFCFCFCFCFWFWFCFCFWFSFIQNELVPFVANFCHTEMRFFPIEIEPATVIWCTEDLFECFFIFAVGYAFCLLHYAMQSIYCIDEFFWKYANIDKGRIRNVLVKFLWKPLSSVLIHCPIMVKRIDTDWIECHCCCLPSWYV